MSSTYGAIPAGRQQSSATGALAYPTVTYRNILVPLDGSDRAEAALPHAIALARPSGARIVLYSAVENPIIVPPGLAGPAQDVPVASMATIDAVQFAQEAYDAVAQHLDRHARELEALGVAAASRMSNDGDIADQILEIAVNESIDLIVMTTHGRTGLGRLLFGSVAESVLRRAKVPVLLIRTADSE